MTRDSTLPSFDGQAALVTGASRGIGRAIAILLAQCGCDVAINYASDHAAAEETAAAVTQAGRKALLVQADVADGAQAKEMVARATDAFGKLDVLVNNAGMTCNALLPSMPAADIERIVGTNLLGTIYVTQAAAAGMLGNRYGRIVNISSSGAAKPGPGQAAYAAAKGAVESFTRAIAVELGGKGILANVVAPGVTVTDMSAPMREHRHDEVMQRLLLKRYAEPAEVARVVAFLASPANRYVTGEIVNINGGMKMA